MKFIRRIKYNSPVILSYVIISLVVLLLNILTKGYTNIHFFSVYRSSVLSLAFWIRLFGHVLGHGSAAHYMSNMMLMLLVGPILEEKYGSKMLLIMIGTVAVITGLVNIIFFSQAALLGASGVVFMMIIMASVVGMKRGEIPLTLLIVAVIYLGQEVVSGISSTDNISQLTHIIGGVCGGVFALRMNR